MEVVGEDGELSYELEHCDIPTCASLEYCDEVLERAWDYGRPQNVPSYALVTNQASLLERSFFLQTYGTANPWVEVDDSLPNASSNFTNAMRYPSSIEVRTVSNAPLALTFRVRKELQLVETALSGGTRMARRWRAAKSSPGHCAKSFSETSP